MAVDDGDMPNSVLTCDKDIAPVGSANFYFPFNSFISDFNSLIASIRTDVSLP